MALVQNCGVCIVVLIFGTAINSTRHLFLSNKDISDTTGYAELSGPNGKTAYIAAQISCSALSCSRPYSELAALHVTQ